LFLALFFSFIPGLQSFSSSFLDFLSLLSFLSFLPLLLLKLPLLSRSHVFKLNFGRLWSYFITFLELQFIPFVFGFGSRRFRSFNRDDILLNRETCEGAFPYGVYMPVFED